MRLLRGSLLTLVLGLLAPPAGAVTISFEEPELDGLFDFEFAGTAWTGGAVQFLAIGALYTSGHRSYVIGIGPGDGSGQGSVDFGDNVATQVSFAFMHGSGFAPANALVFDENGELAMTVASVQGVGVATPPIELGELRVSRIEFQGGVVDTFVFELPEPARGLLAAAAAAGLALLRMRRHG